MLGLERKDSWRKSCHLSLIQGEKIKGGYLGSGNLALLRVSQSPRQRSKQGMVTMTASQGQIKTFRDLNTEKMMIPPSSCVIQKTPSCKI